MGKSEVAKSGGSERDSESLRDRNCEMSGKDGRNYAPERPCTVQP